VNCGRTLRGRRIALALFVQVLAFGMLAFAGGSAGADGRGVKSRAGKPVVPGELIVRFKAGVSEEARAEALRGASAKEKRRFRRLDAKLVSAAPDALKEVASKLEADPRVEYVEPNYRVAVDAASNDPFYRELWGLHNAARTSTA
jgi:hypothetical protein